MYYDAVRLSKSGENNAGVGDQQLATTDTTPADDGGWGLLGEVAGYLSDLSGRATDALGPIADWSSEHQSSIVDRVGNVGDNVGIALDPVTGPIGDTVSEAVDVSGLDSAARNVWKNTGNSEAFKTFTRNAFSASEMPRQAIVSWEANITADLDKKDYGSMLLHLASILPGVEAGFVAAENVTGTDFYRGGDGPDRRMTTWGQTDYGQVILDAFGQGGQEYLKGADVANDPTGTQYSQGTGYFMGKEYLKLQEDARLAANTIVEQTPITEEEAKNILKVGRLSGPAEAEAYAQRQGLQWSAEDDEWVHPAQGWTPGRAVAYSVYEPGTTAANTLSGVIDFGFASIGDPINWIPGGAIKKLFTVLRRGGKIVNGAADSTMFVSRVDNLVDSGDLLDALRYGDANLDEVIAIKGLHLDLVNNKTGEVAKTGKEIKAALDAGSTYDDLVNGIGLLPKRNRKVAPFRFNLSTERPDAVMTPAEYQSIISSGERTTEMFRNGGGVVASTRLELANYTRELSYWPDARTDDEVMATWFALKAVDGNYTPRNHAPPAFDRPGWLTGYSDGRRGLPHRQPQETPMSRLTRTR